MGEYVEETQVTYNVEWTRHHNADGSVVYNSNTGLSQTEPPPGFEAAFEQQKESKVEPEPVASTAESTAPAAEVEDVQVVEEEVVEEGEEPEEASQTATALYAYVAVGDNQCNLTEGEVVVILEEDNGGWTGVQSTSNEEAGFVPSSYLSFN